MSEENKKEEKLIIGDESVVMGKVSGVVGNKSVVIGATDNNGSVILNKTMAVGHNAFAGPGSIAIGAGANAGGNIYEAINELGQYIKVTGDESLIRSYNDFSSEIAKPEKNKTVLDGLWANLKAAATLNGASMLMLRISDWLSKL